jgi:hypothetical protein
MYTKTVQKLRKISSQQNVHGSQDMYAQDPSITKKIQFFFVYFATNNNKIHKIYKQT